MDVTIYRQLGFVRVGQQLYDCREMWTLHKMWEDMPVKQYYVSEDDTGTCFCIKENVDVWPVAFAFTITLTAEPREYSSYAVIYSYPPYKRFTSKKTVLECVRIAQRQCWRHVWRCVAKRRIAVAMGLRSGPMQVLQEDLLRLIATVY